MTQIDAIFIVYGVLTVILLVLTFVILRKSLSTVNYLFSITPLTFSLVIVLNMLDYFISVPAIIPRIPYLLAPLGILFAGLYIFYGSQLRHNSYFLVVSGLYIVFCLLFSFYMVYVFDSLTISLQHLTITFPIILSLYYYFKLRSIIPENKNAINALLIGLLIIIAGAILRAYYFLTVSIQGDYVPGLVLIFVGILISILSFTTFSEKQST